MVEQSVYDKLNQSYRFFSILIKKIPISILKICNSDVTENCLEDNHVFIIILADIKIVCPF